MACLRDSDKVVDWILGVWVIRLWEFLGNWNVTQVYS